VVISYPDVSKDFPKLVRTLGTTFSEGIFDYWDDLVLKIYQNAENPNLDLQTYFKKVQWVHLDKPYPTCPELESDWAFLKDRHVFLVDEKQTKYKVDKEILLGSSLAEYAENKELPSLVAS
jgi:hypothetical protein